MKNIQLLFTLLLILTLFSCGKDDSEKSANTIQGAWKLVSMEYTGTTSTSILGQDVIQNFTGTGKDMDLTMDLKSEDTYVSSGTYTVSLTTMTNGFPITQEVTYTDFLGNGTYDYNDPTIMFSDGENESTGTVTELDENNLTINIITTQNQIAAGIASTVSVDYNVSFSK